MNHKELQKLLSSKHKFIFIGEENYLILYALDYLKKSLAPDFVMFNCIEMEQKELSYSDCMLKLDSVPMMDSKKIVHIKNFNFAVESNTWSKKELQEFEEKITDLSEDTVLILSNENMAKAGNAKLIKDYGKKMELLSFDRLSQKDLLDFIMERLEKSIGKNMISKEVLTLFIQVSGYLQKESKVNLFAIDTMLSKLESFHREYGKVEPDDIYELFEEKADGDIFRMIDAIAAGNKREAFRHFYGLRQKGEPNIKIMVTIGKIFSTAVKASYYFEQGYSADDAARELKKSPYAVRSASSLLRKLGRAKLVDIIDKIVEVDFKMKAGWLDEKVYGELALMKIFDIVEEKAKQKP